MATINQLVKKNSRIKKKKKCLVKGLEKCPQKKGIVLKAYIEKPKKPNSAKRKCIKVKIKMKTKFNADRILSCHVPGEKHTLNKHSIVLLRGGRAQDLIGVRYKPIRGWFDCLPVATRVSRRSKYGITHPNKKTPKRPNKRRRRRRRAR